MFFQISFLLDGVMMESLYKITMCDMCGCCTDGVSIINTITDKQVQYLDFV